jgi:hypothetical protein
MQGHLNGLLAMRMMKGGFASDPLVQVNGKSIIDPTLAFYRGDSQGGIMGTTYMAVSTDVTRGLLGEPGVPYNLLLNRSEDYSGYNLLLSAPYPNGLDRQLFLGLMQIPWDRTEPDGFVPYITDNTLAGTPSHNVLIHDGIGDFQVTTLGAHIIARSIGAKNLKPVNREVWGVDDVDGPTSGNVLVEYFFNLPPVPNGNIPNTSKFGDIDDPHDKVRKEDPSYAQADEFFRTGMVSVKCNGGMGPCNCVDVLASSQLSSDDMASCMRQPMQPDPDSP